jgi:hypothetical protein
MMNYDTALIVKKHKRKKEKKRKRKKILERKDKLCRFCNKEKSSNKFLLYISRIIFCGLKFFRFLSVYS